MAHDDPQGADNAGKRAQISEAERRDKLTPLVLRRSKLSASEALLLRKVFPEILASHQDRVWNRLRKRGLLDQEAEDLVQDTFLALYNHILEHGFPDSLSGMLRVFTDGKLLNHLRTERRDPVSVGLPSSGSEKPRSDLDGERFLTRRDLARRLIDQLSPEHQSVINTIILHDLSHHDAAALLGVPEGTVKSRLIAAKHELWVLANRLLPPSQRGPL
jgi:RNA polymerase sigma factor (sigma-70 family)